MGSLGRESLHGSRASFVLRRTRSAPLLPASLLLAVLISVIVTTALASFGRAALPAAAHKRLATAPDASILVSGQFGAARAGADTRVIGSTARAALGTVPFTLATGRWSDQLALPRGGGAGQTSLIQAAVLDHVTAHAVLTAGAWPGPQPPGAAIGVALPVSTASMLGLSPGETLVLRDSLTGARARLRVTGLYRPRDPSAAYWRLSLLGTSGRQVQGSFVTYGPMLVNPAALGPGGLPVSAASWLITVDTARVPAAGMAALGRRLSAVTGSWQSRTDLDGLQVSTSLPQILAALASSLVVARSLLLIGSLQLLLLATATAALAARLLAGQREEETALLSARGAARAHLLGASLAEASLLAGIGVVAGIAGGSYLADLLLSASGLGYARPGGGLPGAVRQTFASGAWWPAAVIMALVVIVVMWPALQPGSPGALRLRRGRQAVLASTARAGLDAALIALGALALWQLRTYSAVTSLSGSGLGVDPVLVVAPVLALAGIALLPLRALPAAARLLDRLSARGRRLVAALASWQVSRRPVREGGPILMVVLAVATGTLVLAQHQSWRQSQLDQAAFATGADVSVTLAAPLPAGRGQALAHARGVRTAMPVSAFASGYDVLALDATEAAATVALRPDLSPLPSAALWRLITPRGAPPGLALPGRPDRLEISASLTPRGGRSGPLAASLSVQDGWGIVYAIPAGRLPADGRDHRLTASLAAAGQARYPLRLLGLSLSYQLPGFPPPAGNGLASDLAEHRAAAARVTLAIRGLAVSPRPAGGFPAPFAGPGTLIRWQAAAASPDFASPLVTGIRPAITGWQASGGAATLTFTTGAGHLIARQGLTPQPVSGQLELAGRYSQAPIPAIATRAFLASANTRVGAVVPLPVGNATVQVRLAAGIRAFPSTGGQGAALIVDQAALQEALAGQSQPPLPVTQWWLRTAHGAAPVLPAGAAVASTAGTATRLLDDPLPNVPQLSLLVIVLAAGVLACAGFAVSVAAAVRERRLQDALLAALGMGRAARAGQLCLEQLMLSLPASVAGAVIGAVLARLLVPAVTLTAGATAPFPPVLVVIPLGWTALLALGIAVVPVLAAVAAAAYWPDPAAELRAGESA